MKRERLNWTCKYEPLIEPKYWLLDAVPTVRSNFQNFTAGNITTITRHGRELSIGSRREGGKRKFVGHTEGGRRRQNGGRVWFFPKPSARYHNNTYGAQYDNIVYTNNINEIRHTLLITVSVDSYGFPSPF